MHLAYIASRYPFVSHTFIQGEIEALRQRGVVIDTISIRAPGRQEARSARDRYALTTTYSLLPPGARDLAGAALAAVHHPGAALAMVRHALRRGRSRWLKGMLWQLFYSAEALLVWRHCQRIGVRHLHAHFANVASDVARLACYFGRRTGLPDADRWSWSFTMHGSAEFFAVEDHDLGGKVADADLVICISDFCRSQLMAFAGSEHWHKLQVVHCGIDGDRFPAVDRTGRTGPVRILYVGRVVAAKGIDLLLDAVSALVAGGADVEVVLIGDGPDRPGFEARSAQLGLSDRVRFEGAVGQDDIPAYYAEADLFCLASFAEGVPVVLMEAMASGLPVVAPRITGIPELVDDGVAGVLFTVGRVDVLTAALASLVDDHERRARMGCAGRAAVLSGFDTNASARTIEHLFAGLPGTRTAPPPEP